MIPGLKVPTETIAFSNDAITFTVVLPQLPRCVEEAETICKDIAKTGLYCGIIYQYTNRLNGKKYIGQTIHPVNRHKNHIQTSKSRKPITAWGKALKKHHFSCFLYQVLDLIVDRDEQSLRTKLNEKEIHYINLHKSSVKEHGYNIASGGWSLPKGSSIEKAVDMFDLSGHYIQTFPSISKANAQFGFTGPTIRKVCNHQQYIAGGYLWAWSGKSPRLAPDKRVYTYDENGVYLKEYANQYVAAKELGISYGNISNAIKDKHRLVNNRYWRTYKRAVIPLSDFPKAVYAYDKQGNFVVGFPCLKKAAEYVKDLSTSAISHSIINKRFHKGYYWRREYCEYLHIGHEL